MRIIKLALILITIFSAPSIFADMVPDSKACDAIAKSCAEAGFTHANTKDKRLWHDCMKPLLLGKTVAGINIDADTVKTCRADKIVNLRKEIKELKRAAR